MEKKARKQFLIGGLIMLVGIGMYFSGIDLGQEGECEIVGRQGGNAAGDGIQSCDESAIQESTMHVIILVIGMVFMIRGILTMRSSSLK
jgi:hypothetical protein